MTDQWASDDVIRSAQDAYDALRYVSEESPCPYLPDRSSRSEAYSADQLEGAAYEQLLRRGFRRSGRIVYRPRCRACLECRQLRVPVYRFAPTRSMRRIRRLNSDVGVEVGEPAVTDQKHALFRRYLDAHHDDAMSDDYESFRRFLYDSPMETQEVCYRLGERLVGVSIVDRCPSGLSSVYMYFDPEYRRRSLGTFSVLWEIDFCKQQRLSYYYMGYYVAGAKTMAYKSRFRPNEVLSGNDCWVPLRR